MSIDAGRPMPIVLDASVALAIALPDEVAPPVVVDLLGSEPAVVPAHWPLEVTNALRSARASGRFRAASLPAVSLMLRDLAVAVEDISLRDAVDEVLPLAIEAGLTSYDAAYLALAQRRGIPLLTLDARLRAAATARGIEVLPSEVGGSATRPSA